MKNLGFVIPEKWNYGFNSLFAIRLINIQIPIYQAVCQHKNQKPARRKMRRAGLVIFILLYMSASKKFMLGIPFVITNYRKGVFFAIFRDRSGAVHQVQQPSRSQKIIKKCALFGA